MHLALSRALSFALSASGAVLWIDAGPLWLLDGSVQVHAWSTWGFLALLVLHLVAARQKIAEGPAAGLRIRGRARIGARDDEADA